MCCPGFVPYSIVFTLCLDIIKMFILIIIICIVYNCIFLFLFICALPCKEFYLFYKYHKINIFFNFRKDSDFANMILCLH